MNVAVTPEVYAAAGPRVTYRDRVTSVELGDHVQMRVFFRRRTGRVVYVPGISARNSTMEFNGLTWVGVRLENGDFISLVVDPRESYLRNKVAFLRRDLAGFTALGADEDPHSGGETGASW